MRGKDTNHWCSSFDSLNHQALIQCMRRLGVHEPILNYIGEIYREAVVLVGKDGVETEQKSGVAQGDPLSGWIFNGSINKVPGNPAHAYSVR